MMEIISIKDLLWCIRSELIYRDFKDSDNNNRRYYGVNMWVKDLKDKPLNDVHYHLSQSLFHIVGNSDT